jgi:CubicO group peptidase (beta-lactamase class C family)
MMQGYGGQFVYVVPDHDLVVVFTGALPQQRYYTPRRLLSDYVEAAVIAGHAVSANPTATARLDSLVAVLAGESEKPLQPAPDIAQVVSGKTFKFDDNRMGLRRMILHLTPGASEAELEFVVGTVPGSITIGLDGVFRMTALYGQRWACRGGWVDRDTFVLEQEALGKVVRRRVTLNFHGDTLNFETHDRVTDAVDVYGATMVGPPVSD